jgi:diadenylate cyclase
LHIYALNWLLGRFSVYLAVAMLVIFQPEIRRALAELGRQPLFTPPTESRGFVDSIVDAVMLLAERRIGALIAIERTESTRAIQETGVKLDARVNADLLASLFFPHTPLHDGGVIVSGNRIVAAGCLFPLCQRPELSRGLGTRHRAAMGLTEESDAIAVVVSEETGTVSISTRGRLSRDFDEERLRRFLSAVLTKEQTAASRWTRARQQLDLSLRGIAKSEDMVRREDALRDG